jgi:hypothetical protein
VPCWNSSSALIREICGHLLGDADVLGLGEKAERFFAAFAADAALFHAAEGNAEIADEPAIYTVLALGNAFATSGSRTTTFAPAAYRRAYLPRVACEKS